MYLTIEKEKLANGKTVYWGCQNFGNGFAKCVQFKNKRLACRWVKWQQQERGKRICPTGKMEVVFSEKGEKCQNQT